MIIFNKIYSKIMKEVQWKVQQLEHQFEHRMSARVSHTVSPIKLELDSLSAQVDIYKKFVDDLKERIILLEGKENNQKIIDTAIEYAVKNKAVYLRQHLYDKICENCKEGLNEEFWDKEKEVIRDD